MGKNIIVDFDAVIAATAEASALVQAIWADDSVTKVWNKSPDNPVSEADIASDKLLKDRLSAICPEAGWLSEETADDSDRLDKELLWVVDPIDGTRDFIRGRSGWAVSVALVKNHRPIFGILDAPARGECWIAKEGHGATLNGSMVRASMRQDFMGSRVPADQLPKIDYDLVTVEKPNSIALRMAMVADNRADLVATLRWGNEWDVAAADLIASEAGASVSNALGKALTYNNERPQAFGVLCCSAGIHEAAVDRISDRARQILGDG